MNNVVWFVQMFSQQGEKRAKVWNFSYLFSYYCLAMLFMSESIALLRAQFGGTLWIIQCVGLCKSWILIGCPGL